MIKAAIRRTPFNTEIASEFFSNITGDVYMNDDVLVSVARAILPPRMKEGDKVHFRYTSKYIQPGQRFSGNSEECEAYVASGIDLDSSDLVTVYCFSGCTAEDSAQYMDAIKEHFVSKHQGWEENMKVQDAYARVFPIRAYANREKRSSVIFMGEIDMKRLRCGITAVFGTMPWYFDKDLHPLSEDEATLLLCLRERCPEEESKQKFMAAMNRIAAQYDFDKIRVSKLLDGFETRYERRAIDLVTREIAANDQRIENLNQQIADQLKQRRDNTIRLSGLKMRIGEAGEASAIRDLFLSNPRLYLEDVSNDTITFSVKTDLEYFDKDEMESAIDNDESWVYEGGRIPAEDMVTLLRALFTDETLKLQFCGCYQLELAGQVKAVTHHEFPDGFDNYMPNTHINEYHCTGGHGPAINTCLQNGDYVGAIMQCIASCQSLNFGDFTVMESFMKFLYRDAYSAVRLPDGRVVKPSAAIEWLKEQEVQGGQEESEAPAEAEA